MSGVTTSYKRREVDAQVEGAKPDPNGPVWTSNPSTQSSLSNQYWMITFADLYERLDATTSTNRKVAAMVDYFGVAPPGDAAWAVFFLSGNRCKRLVRSGDLRLWMQEETGLPDWLVEDCYSTAGDLAETISLLLDQPDLSTDGSHGRGKVSVRASARGSVLRSADRSSDAVEAFELTGESVAERADRKSVV